MASTYAWRVQGWQDESESKGTADDLSEAVEVNGPRDATDEQIKALNAIDTRADKATGDDTYVVSPHDNRTVCHPFRMWDDDRMTYLYGFVTFTDGGTPWAQDDVAAFGPLTDYGAPSYGQTSIEYRRNGRWEMI